MPERRTVQYDGKIIPYTVEYVKRKTLGITVHPDLRVSVRAPKGISNDIINALMLKRAPWIFKKQQEFQDNPMRPPPQNYASGEIHYFLGKAYRLKVIQGAKDSVQQEGRWMKVTVREKDPARVKRILDGWYREFAQIIFSQRLAKCFPMVAHLGIPYPELVLRMMKSSWGNAHVGKTRITLNVKLVRMPIEGIDLVIVHELCHLAEPNHGKKFYALMERVLPDWKARRARLQELWVV